MSKMGRRIRQAIRNAIAELGAMDKKELRSEIQAREIGEVGSILLETGALETGPLHVGVDIFAWEDPVDLAGDPPSWVCLEMEAAKVSSQFESVTVRCHVAPPSTDKLSMEMSTPVGADDYHYSLAA